MLTFKDLRNDAIDKLKDRLTLEMQLTDEDVILIIRDVVERIIPVYTHEVLQITLSHPELACVMPKC